MGKVEVKGKVLPFVRGAIGDIHFELGRTQMQLNISATGSLARKLKLKDGQEVLVTIENLEEV